jgi:hypothetical protein
MNKGLSFGRAMSNAILMASGVVIGFAYEPTLSYPTFQALIMQRWGYDLGEMEYRLGCVFLIPLAIWIATWLIISIAKFVYESMHKA